jgi:1,2-diacylglycerol 3-beta-galactosyltransferase
MSPMSKLKKKILILTSDTGFGHRSAANAISEALIEVYGHECECKIINPFIDKHAPAFIRKSQTNYDVIVRASPELYWLSYASSDQPFSRQMVEGAFSIWLNKTIRTILLEERPDVIVSTYLECNPPLTTALRILKHQVPIFTVITELKSVHKTWYQGKPQKIFVANDGVCNEALRAGVAAEKIFVSGIPVNLMIAKEKRSKDEIRTELGWELGLTTLLSVGSRRVDNLIGNLKAINGNDLPIQAIAVAGGDDSLYQQLQCIKWQVPVRLYNYVHNIPQMLHAADIVITKAGGLIISESLACGLPMILVDIIPGQETGNAAFVCEQNAGEVVKTPKDMLITLHHWLSGGQKELKEISANACKLGKSDAAFTIADEIWKIGIKKLI